MYVFVDPHEAARSYSGREAAKAGMVDEARTTGAAQVAPFARVRRDVMGGHDSFLWVILCRSSNSRWVLEGFTGDKGNLSLVYTNNGQ